MASDAVSTLRIVLRAQDQASRVLGTVGVNMRSLAGAAKVLGGALGGISVIGAIALIDKLGSLIFSASEADKELQKLNETLKIISLTSLTSAKQIEELAARLGRLGIETDAQVDLLKQLYNSMVDARDVSSLAAKSFESLGVQAIEPATGRLRELDKVFSELAKSFERRPFTTELGEDIQAIFGPQGLLEFKKIRELGDTASRLFGKDFRPLGVPDYLREDIAPKLPPVVGGRVLAERAKAAEETAKKVAQIEDQSAKERARVEAEALRAIQARKRAVEQIGQMELDIQGALGGKVGEINAQFEERKRLLVDLLTSHTGEERKIAQLLVLSEKLRDVELKRAEKEGFVLERHDVLGEMVEKNAKLLKIEEARIVALKEMASVAVAGALQGAIDRMVEGGHELEEIFKNLALDLARAAQQAALMMAVRTAFGLPAVSGLAEGGVVQGRMRGSLPMRRYQGGGIATSPQLALFGEGPGAEAFVPLPDGRSIPVKMQGGGQPVVINVSAMDSKSFETWSQSEGYRGMVATVRRALVQDGSLRGQVRGMGAG